MVIATLNVALGSAMPLQKSRRISQKAAHQELGDGFLSAITITITTTTTRLLALNYYHSTTITRLLSLDYYHSTTLTRLLSLENSDTRYSTLLGEGEARVAFRSTCIMLIGVHNSTFRPISVDFQNFQRKLSADYQSARRGVYHSSRFDRY